VRTRGVLDRTPQGLNVEYARQRGKIRLRSRTLVRHPG
jgi:hypothetical protein